MTQFTTCAKATPSHRENDSQKSEGLKICAACSQFGVNKTVPHRVPHRHSSHQKGDLNPGKFPVQTRICFESYFTGGKVCSRGCVSQGREVLRALGTRQLFVCQTARTVRRGASLAPPREGSKDASGGFRVVDNNYAVPLSPWGRGSVNAPQNGSPEYKIQLQENKIHFLHMILWLELGTYRLLSNGKNSGIRVRLPWTSV